MGNNLHTYMQGPSNPDNNCLGLLGSYKITLILISRMHGRLSHSIVLKEPPTKMYYPRIRAKGPPIAILLSKKYKGFSKSEKGKSCNTIYIFGKFVRQSWISG